MIQRLSSTVIFQDVDRVLLSVCVGPHLYNLLDKCRTYFSRNLWCVISHPLSIEAQRFLHDRNSSRVHVPNLSNL